MDKNFWDVAFVCAVFLAMYCHGSVLVASILSYPALRGVSLLLGGVADSRMPKTREGRIKAAVVYAAISAGLVSFLPAAALLTINRSGSVLPRFLILIQAVLALAWTAWLYRWTKRRMAALPQADSEHQPEPVPLNSSATPGPKRLRHRRK